MGNTNSFKVRTDKEAEEAIDMVFNRDHDWGEGLLNGRIKIEEFGTIAFPEIFLSKVPDVLDHDTFSQCRDSFLSKIANFMSNLGLEKFPISRQGQDAKYTHDEYGRLGSIHQK